MKNKIEDVNMLHCGNNIEVMKQMDDGSVDLIYADPPFFTQKDWGEYDDRWENITAYRAYIGLVMIEALRVLKDSGSIYVHCNDVASHHIRTVLDEVFGSCNFRNEIIWCYGGRGMAKKHFNRKHDTIFFYSKTDGYTFNTEHASRPVDKDSIGRYNKVDEKGERYARIKNKDGSYSNIYLKDVIMEDWWRIPYVRGDEVVGYPTQKPIELLERIISVSTNEGDVVLDPFLGSGTSIVVAQSMGRRWIGIDLSKKSIEITNSRMESSVKLF